LPVKGETDYSNLSHLFLSQLSAATAQYRLLQAGEVRALPARLQQAVLTGTLCHYWSHPFENRYSCLLYDARIRIRNLVSPLDEGPLFEKLISKSFKFAPP
jgi:hypothetical protein